MSHRRKSRQLDKERTYTIPPTIWFLMFFGGIALGFLFGVSILIMLLLLFSTIFHELATIMGSILTIIIGLIIIYILRRYIVNFGALIFGLIIGVILAILWLQMGWWSPISPGGTELPSISLIIKEWSLWRASAI